MDQSAIEQELQTRGWRCIDKKPGGRKVVRLRHRSPDGKWQILIDTEEHPWWTVQRVGASGHVRWYVDFPQEAGIEAVFSFVMLQEARVEPEIVTPKRRKTRKFDNSLRA
jgi:hypothetical protein